MKKFMSAKFKKISSNLYGIKNSKTRGKLFEAAPYVVVRSPGVSVG